MAVKIQTREFCSMAVDGEHFAGHPAACIYMHIYIYIYIYVCVCVCVCMRQEGICIYKHLKAKDTGFLRNIGTKPQHYVMS